MAGEAGVLDRELEGVSERGDRLELERLAAELEALSVFLRVRCYRPGEDRYDWMRANAKVRKALAAVRFLLRA